MAQLSKYILKVGHCLLTSESNDEQHVYIVVNNICDRCRQSKPSYSPPFTSVITFHLAVGQCFKVISFTMQSCYPNTPARNEARF